MPQLHVIILTRIPVISEQLSALLADERDMRISVLAPSDELIDDLLGDELAVMLLDVEVLENEGWDLLDQIRRALPGLTTLILSDNGRDRRVPRALHYGVRGYLLRDSSANELAGAIRAAHTGSLVFHPQIGDALLDLIPRARDDEPNANDDLIEPLSERELDVLRLMTRGMSNKQIAAELVITEHTVKFHTRSILGKFGAANRTEAVTLALQKGLVSL